MIFQFAKDEVCPLFNDIVLQTTVPIFDRSSNNVRKVGGIYVAETPEPYVATGNLFQIDGHQFIITARHVLDEFLKDESALSLGIGDPPLVSRIDVEPSDVARDDKRDIAVLRLRDVSRFVNKSFMELGDFCSDKSSADWHLAIAGFLQQGTMNNRDGSSVRAECYHRFGRRYEGKTSAKRSYNADDHLLVSYPEQSYHTSGLLVQTPTSLKGMSGCCIRIAFNDDHIEAPDSWSPDLMKVIAIQSLVYEGRVMQATWIWHVLPLFATVAPELSKLTEPYIGSASSI